MNNHTSINKPSAVTRVLGIVVASVVLLALVMSVACKPPPAPDAFTISTATPSLGGYVSSSFTPEPQVPYVISGIPHCQGIQELDAPIFFDWPNLDEAFEKLADYNWGYYECAISQPALKSLLKDKMVQPPYLWQEVVWIDRETNSGAMFFHNVYRSWIYMWMLPQSNDKASHLVIAKGDPGMPQTWDCRLLIPNLISALTCSDCRRRVN